MDKRPVIVAFIILIFLTIGGSGAGIYYYSEYRKLAQRFNNPQAEVKDILTKVGKLMELPEGEEPTVATVQDAEQIRSQPFFAKAQNGQRVILYTNARIAILFDEKANKIINVGAVNVGTPSATTPEVTPEH
ncbi:hypothetical protein KJZ67_00725 [Patescibacteria group bacterium]|nr:hypothetical protein [Patescibacteria group bacterium]